MFFPIGELKEWDNIPESLNEETLLRSKKNSNMINDAFDFSNCESDLTKMARSVMESSMTTSMEENILVKKRGFSVIGLSNPKFSNNIGSVLRACSAFDVSMLAVSGTRYKRSVTDTPKAWKHMPFLQVDDLHNVIPYDCVPVAVDLVPNAQNIINYKHPERAMYIFGPEDGTLGSNILSWCKDVIYVPTNICMNLAATVHVILYDRLLKQS